MHIYRRKTKKNYIILFKTIIIRRQWCDSCACLYKCDEYSEIYSRSVGVVVWSVVVYFLYSPFFLCLALMMHTYISGRSEEERVTTEARVCSLFLSVRFQFLPIVPHSPCVLLCNACVNIACKIVYLLLVYKFLFLIFMLTCGKAMITVALQQKIITNIVVVDYLQLTMWRDDDSAIIISSIKATIIYICC
jgi:hypothetical protein